MQYQWLVSPVTIEILLSLSALQDTVEIKVIGYTSWQYITFWLAAVVLINGNIWGT
jgi:hypothetical protein